MAPPPRFAHAVTAVQKAFAQGLGCTPAAFVPEQLTIIDRLDPPAWPYTAFLLTFGTGMVLSLDPAYRAFAEALGPVQHYRVTADLLYPLATEGARRGVPMDVQAPALGFALAQPPGDVEVPAGLTLDVVDATWMTAEMAHHRFPNGVGEPGSGGREARNQVAAVLFDAAGAPVAVAGTFQTFGLSEIGVDVVPAYQGRGLAPLVVRAATDAILARGAEPFYACAATNVRSHRTALAAGFLPVCSDAAVTPTRAAG